MRLILCRLLPTTCLIWALTLSASGQDLGWDELRSVTERMIHLRVPDAKIAARLRRVKATEQVPEAAVEAAASWDAGPLTQRELRRIAEKSASRPAPPASSSGMRRSMLGLPTIRGGEASVVLETIRLYAQEYSESIPNFLCFRNTRFLQDSNGLGRWKLQTELGERLSHVGDEDEHEIVSIDGEKVDGDVLFFPGGISVSGEFGNVMRRIFDPASETTFTWLREETQDGQNRVILGFRVPQETSSMRVSAGDADDQEVVGYTGEAHASPETGQIFRVRLTMDELPKGYPMRGGTWDIRYGLVKVEEQELLLPVAAVTEAYQMGQFVRNEATYTNYQKYTADSSIRFEGTPSIQQ
jgi:hypothetical protein